MRYLLDTDTCIWVLRGREPVASRFRELSPADVAIASMTLAELRFGAINSSDPSGSQARLDALLGSGINVVPFDADAAHHHADLRFATRAQPVGERDMVIAATALTGGFTIVTSNTREFGRIPGLPVMNWRT